MSIYNIAVYENTTALRDIYRYLPEVTVITEILLNVIGIAPLSLLIYLFLKIKCFHFNLTFLLIDLMASYLIRTVSRIAICFFVMSSNGAEERHIIATYLDFCCGICQYVCGMNLWLIFMERLYATSKAKNYERQFTPVIIVLLILFKWIIVGVFLFLTAYSRITMIVPIIACAGLLIISGIGMAYLLNFNYKLYKNQNDSKRTLSYRYQISENVRSFEMLIPMMTLLLLGCIVTMIVYALMMFLSDILLKAILGALFNLIIAGGAIVLPIVTMFTHRNLRKRIVKAMRRRKVKKARVSSNSPSYELHENPTVATIAVPLTLTGKKLIMETPDEATQVYFSQITSMWN